MSWDTWDDLNHSELVRLAYAASARVHRGTPRDVLILLLSEDNVDVSFPPRGVDLARTAIFEMVDRYWKQVKSLIPCPMRSRQPRACFSCTDLQVAECSLLNAKLITEDGTNV